MRLVPPLSARLRPAGVRVVEPMGALNVTSMPATGVFRELGETVASDVMVTGLTTVVVAWADAGVGWTLPTLSVATL